METISEEEAQSSAEMGTTEGVGTTTTADIEHITNWQPKVFEEGPVTPESAAEELARFRMRAGGDMSVDFRDGYRSWRLGRSTGATESTSGAVGCHPAARFEATIDRAEATVALYPRLAPAERNTARYWWRYTVSYWVATSFMIGSVLFVVGAAFDYAHKHSDRPNAVRTSSTVQWPYFIGGIFFMVGSYLGFFAAINLGRREDSEPRFVVFAPPCYLCRLFCRRLCVFCYLMRRLAKRQSRVLAHEISSGLHGDDSRALLDPSSSTTNGRRSLSSSATTSDINTTRGGTDNTQEEQGIEGGNSIVVDREEDFQELDIEPEAWHSYWGYLSYLIGAVWFQLGILAEILISSEYIQAVPHSIKQNILTALPATLGGVFFVLGSMLAVELNESWRPSLAFTDVTWWVSNADFIGSLLFLEAGIFSFSDISGIASDSLTIKLPYLIGSFGFLVASTLELFMWRVDLHGLSFVRAINKSTKLYELVRDLLKTGDPLLSITSDTFQTQDVSGVSLNQLGFVFVVVLTYAFSIIDLVFAVRLSPCRQSPSGFWTSAYDIYDAALQSLICFAALALASVVHTVPRQRPFGMLLWSLRVVMVFLLVRYVWKFVYAWKTSAHACGQGRSKHGHRGG
uniref:Uncharacterized protein n=1 Tax=Aureoumbra lagunensis TaxID=44058 RepID=A0A7S3K2V1_9STRA|mmetsp:Transcript_6790/g.9503  ORF Transcript_6790/g.9503 Transcript_6790/m.9503 type:complete len:627 (+) Transcript_6790:119-1999(+)|eukprot:CAMPEP_0197293584 /NCGR_PEP_ID=MMETSP0890-20130614/29240_1 /TAXON_ID=44058 ORGANISM="Aureoumbra lagunensis, Strain CCMP1510" /NCGR_SAMPLE_ID=MMETSP0890 /ASSEMBLY_ACC=CAM_ASM_000533 /LENGTH=626 /DNA_ID=CAMNT_0042768465 /DNA_START=101 /DNA_END=1981 /DNA_ORIENTATION=-